MKQNLPPDKSKPAAKIVDQMPPIDPVELEKECRDLLSNPQDWIPLEDVVREIKEEHGIA